MKFIKLLMFLNRNAWSNCITKCRITLRTMHNKTYTKCVQLLNANPAEHAKTVTLITAILFHLVLQENKC